MVLEKPGVQQGGARAFRATTGASSRATTTIIFLIGVRAFHITITASSAVAVDSVGIRSITFICAQYRGVSASGDGQGTISASCDQLGGVQRGPGRGRLWGR